MTDPDAPPLAGERIAIIGAGVAGLTAARRLARAGADVTIFERNAGPGGRLGAADPSSPLADRGAQYFTAREPAFKAWVARARLDGLVTPWSPRGKDSDEDWLIGLPAMASLLAALVDSITLRGGADACAISRTDDGLSVGFTATETAIGFNRVVVATPARAARQLLGPYGDAFAPLAGADIKPCWTLSADFPAFADPGFDIARGRGPFAWIARSASRPARPDSGVWVAQADPDWSRANEGRRDDEVRAELTQALAGCLGAGEPERAEAHFWPEALVAEPVGAPFLMTADGRIGCCGDYMLAPRVEAAFLSADALAGAMIARRRVSDAAPSA